MIVTKINIDQDFEKLPISDYWSTGPTKELKMHKIHAYPAKFSSFVVNKSLLWAKSKGKTAETIGDIFCGCGTTALEATRNNLPFWGCDINPVATLIAKVKSSQYHSTRLEKEYNSIIETFNDKTSRTIFLTSLPQHERLDYWFNKKEKKDLHFLLCSIKEVTTPGAYQNFFLCAFSNILKGSSRWLTKSIKPQIDPNKIPANVLTSFRNQMEFMIKANHESRMEFKKKSSSQISNSNFLKLRIGEPFVDLLITSPPYVTSYEYADLHQLSSIWLGYSEDYRTLRKGSIGSSYNNEDTLKQINKLNSVGRQIYHELHQYDKSQAKSVARYLLDMQKVTKKAFSLLKDNGMSVFVIGNTSYKGVSVDNAKFLSFCLLEEGFKQIEVYKRKIGPKNLSPYRDEKGKFSHDSSQRKVYSHEFVLIGEK